MFVLICASWSVIFGFHTPLQSGSFARSAQFLAVGAGLMIGFGFSAGWAANALAPVSANIVTKTALKILFIRPLSFGNV